MPYGIKDIDLYIKRRADKNVVYHTPEGSICACCAKDQALSDKYLAAAKFPLEPSALCHQNVHFICANCYGLQYRLKYNRFEELCDHVQSKQTLMVSNKVEKLKARRTKNFAPGVEEFISVFLKHMDDFVALRSELEKLRASFQPRISNIVAPTQNEDRAPIPEDDEDLEFGMTDEQRARMDELSKVGG